MLRRPDRGPPIPRFNEHPTLVVSFPSYALFRSCLSLQLRSIQLANVYFLSLDSQCTLHKALSKQTLEARATIVLLIHLDADRFLCVAGYVNILLVISFTSLN